MKYVWEDENNTHIFVDGGWQKRPEWTPAPMSLEQALECLRECADDTRDAHSKADAVLLRFLETNGFKAISDAYERAADAQGRTWWYT